MVGPWPYLNLLAGVRLYFINFVVREPHSEGITEQCCTYKVVTWISNTCSYTIVCVPVQGDNPQVLACGFSTVQGDKLCYNYFIPPLSTWTLLIVKYFILLARVV